jgi:hypothetical protein
MPSKKITTRVKSFQDACKILNIDPESLPKERPDDPDGPALWAHRQLIIIVKALNEGWTPDWNNSREYKYYPWFNMSGGFSVNRVNGYFATSLVGSRLCFRSRELAQYATEQFKDLYKAYFTYTA